ncbi:Methyltransferase-like protein 24 [Bulinus truncatus]|nr:Methyltransferase-like protein 24 [Bulinus truncatus]
MVGSLFTSKRLLLVIVIALMSVFILYLTVGQQNSQTQPIITNAQYIPVALQQQPPYDTDSKILTEKSNKDKHYNQFEVDEQPDLTKQPTGKPRPGKFVQNKDIVDNSGAKGYLKQYAGLFDERMTGISDVDPNNVTAIQNWWQAAAMIDWYINSPIRYTCKNKMTVGNWHICQDTPYTIKPPCLVYSFGINFDFSFDDAMSKLGCEVHSFDPSMNKETHKRGDNSTFHNLGLSNTNTDGFVPRKDLYVNKPQVWKMRTLKSVFKELGHEKRVLDVLKIDIEGHEWAVIDNMMETDIFKYVRQFMLEFHLFPDWPLKEDYVYLYQIYTRLREMGFREFAVGPHPKTLKVNQFNNQEIYIQFMLFTEHVKQFITLEFMLKKNVYGVMVDFFKNLVVFQVIILLIQFMSLTNISGC